MNNQDEGLRTSDIGLLILILAAVWMWAVLR